MVTVVVVAMLSSSTPETSTTVQQLDLLKTVLADVVVALVVVC